MTNLPPGIVHGRSSRRGITLLEVLLAALLSAILMMGLWSLFTTYSRLFQSGQAKTERAQLVRSLMQRLREDLMAASLEPAETLQTGAVAASGSTFPSGSAMMTGSVVSSMAPTADFGTTTGGFSDAVGSGTFDSRSGGVQVSGRVELAEASVVPRVGLWGTQHVLQLDVMQSVPPAAEEPVGLSPLAGPETDYPQGDASRLPELRTIVYRFFAPGELQAENRETGAGLLRRELDWETALSKRTEMSMTEITAFVAGFSTSTAENAETETTPGFDVEPYDDAMIWVPEIVWLEFRYFDGRGWRSEWDSRRQQALPVAVEVSMVVPSDHPSQRSNAATEDAAIVAGGTGGLPASASGMDIEARMNKPAVALDESEFAELPPDEVYRQLIYIPAAVRPESLSEPAGGTGGLPASEISGLLRTQVDFSFP